MSKLMSKTDYELFEIIVKSSQLKLQKMLYKVLKRHYQHIINTSDYIIAQGDIPVALVAHMDTVFKMPPIDIYFDRKKGVLWSPDGLGADDRAGVFLILKILSSVAPSNKPTIIFTTDEERGCVGSSKLIEDIPNAPWDLKYLIQLDRCGKNDCVFYDDVNAKFEMYVEKFGFKSSWGSFSDISTICPVWGISGVNLSIGYEDEHFEIETLHIKYTYRTFDRVLHMIDDINNAEHFKYEPYEYKKGNWNFNHRLGYYNRWFDDDDDENDYSGYSYGDEVFCKSCGKKVYKIQAVKAKDDYGSWGYYCGDCIPKVKWCESCGEPFVSDSVYNNETNKLCCDCILKSWEEEDYED